LAEVLKFRGLVVYEFRGLVGLEVKVSGVNINYLEFMGINWN